MTAQRRLGPGFRDLRFFMALWLVLAAFPLALLLAARWLPDSPDAPGLAAAPAPAAIAVAAAPPP